MAFIRFPPLSQVGLGKETKTTVTLGFTKSNELFVGRIASAYLNFLRNLFSTNTVTHDLYSVDHTQLCHSACQSSIQYVFAVTFISLTILLLCAVLGVATAIIGELITGKGALAQLGLETGLPIQEIEPFILAGIAFNLVSYPHPISTHTPRHAHTHKHTETEICNILTEDLAGGISDGREANL